MRGRMTAGEALGLVTVQGTNYDGSIHWKHPATLLQAGPGLVQTQTSAGLEIKREAGIFVSRYNTRGHYWPDRWFNVIRLELPGQGLYGFYCNIATPARFDGETVHYTDLQLDVIVRRDGGARLVHSVVDEDEFEEARLRYGYDAGLVARCRAAVDELIAMVGRRAFPFDG